MINDFWETAPTGYKYAVFGGMALTAVGIIIIIIGAISGTSVIAVALPVIGLGLLSHMASLVLRGQSVRKRLRESESYKNAGGKKTS